MPGIYNIELRRDELGARLGGGIPMSSIGLVEGPNGFGKSIFSQRVAYGLIEHDKSVTYISSELSASSFMNQMSSLKYDIQQDFMDKNFKFVSTYPAIGHVNVNDKLINKIFAEDQLFESDLIVIDTLNELLVDYDMSLEETYKLMRAFNQIPSQGKSLLLTLNPDKAEGKLLELLRTSANLYIDLGEKEEYGNILNVMNVKRFQGAKDSFDDEIPFKVRAGIGIVIEISS